VIILHIAYSVQIMVRTHLILMHNHKMHLHVLLQLHLLHKLSVCCCDICCCCSIHITVAAALSRLVVAPHPPKVKGTYTSSFSLLPEPVSSIIIL